MNERTDRTKVYYARAAEFRAADPLEFDRRYSNGRAIQAALRVRRSRFSRPLPEKSDQPGLDKITRLRIAMARAR